MKLQTQFIQLVSLLAITACQSNSNLSSNEPAQPAPFEYPESARWDDARQRYYVSSIGGDPMAPDGIGWISVLDATGQSIQARWVEGLDAPKGMVLVGNKLYVTDVTNLVEIDVERGSIERRIPVDGAVFLNDAAFAHDAVWLTDTFAGAVIRVPLDGAPEVFVRDERLFGANGLVVEDERIVLVTIGDLEDVTVLGGVFTIDLTSKAIAGLGSGSGKFDGIEPRSDGYLLTDFRGQLLRSDRDGELQLLVNLADEGLSSAADLGVTPSGGVLVPDLFGSKVWLGQVD